MYDQIRNKGNISSTNCRHKNFCCCIYTRIKTTSVNKYDFFPLIFRCVLRQMYSIIFPKFNFRVMLRKPLRIVVTQTFLALVHLRRDYITKELIWPYLCIPVTSDDFVIDFPLLYSFKKNFFLSFVVDEAVINVKKNVESERRTPKK